MKTTCRLLILAMLHLCWLTSNAWAEMLPTESVLPSQTKTVPLTDRQLLLDLLKRDRIQKKLYQHGISQEEAMARINSLTEEELTEIRNKVELAAGGHNYGEYDDDPISDLFLEIFLWTALIGLIAVAYFLGLLVKSLVCPFQEDCDLLRPWWDFGDEPDYEYQAPVEQGPLIVLPQNRIESSDSQNPPTALGDECDARQQACEWTVR